MSDLVSILIPCYNAERWIGQAIESALAQTYAPTEVIVIDDGSTDNSLDIIRGYSNHIHWETGPNRGGNATRNRLMELANGKWLQYLDADDYLLPEKVKDQVNFLCDCPDTDVLYGLVTKEDWTAYGITRDLQRIAEPHDPWILLARWYLPQTGGPLWRKSALMEVGGWKLDQPCCQEHELYLRLLTVGKRFTYCPHNGAVYRVWSTSTVCHRDSNEVRRQRRKILADEEAYLRANGELDAARLQAINQARFEMSRLAWRQDRDVALDILREILDANPYFRPLGNQPGGHHPPLIYRMLFRAFGFVTAEKTAELVHTFRSRSKARSRHCNTRVM